jgi:hypothetical protein
LTNNNVNVPLSIEQSDSLQSLIWQGKIKDSADFFSQVNSLISSGIGKVNEPKNITLLDVADDGDGPVDVGSDGLGGTGTG